MSLLRDVAVVYRRQMRITLTSPAALVIGAAQPILYILLFGPLLKPIAAQLDSSDPFSFLVPGLVVQLGLFGALYAGFGLIAELRDGVIESEQVTPASRPALLFGRVLRDVTQLSMQCVLLVAVGYLMGMRAQPGGVLVGIVLALLLGGACSMASNGLAMRTRSEALLAPVINVVTMPVLLLSGILLPMTFGPGWLQALANAMPTRHVVDAVRAAFSGEVMGLGVAGGLTSVALLLVVASLWGVRSFGRQRA